MGSDREEAAKWGRGKPVVSERERRAIEEEVGGRGGSNRGREGALAEGFFPGLIWGDISYGASQLRRRREPWLCLRPIVCRLS